MSVHTHTRSVPSARACARAVTARGSRLPQRAGISGARDQQAGRQQKQALDMLMLMLSVCVYAYAYYEAYGL